MLARRTTIRLPAGSVVELPRLVPSFSSKGFPFFRDKRRLYSEVTLALDVIGPHINDSVLLSAYDLHYGYLRRPGRFYRGKDLVFVDSGGYELSQDWDSTESKQTPHEPLNFSDPDYCEVLRKLPRGLPIIAASYDWGSRGTPIEEQIISAQKLFNKFPHLVSNFLVKPTGNRKLLDIDELIRHIPKLSAFDVMGVTEKELGTNLIDRLKNLAKLRVRMDMEKLTIPIHVWGGLDPVITPLYFFAGAEIFDGVSWLRYAYHNGVAIYRDSYGVLSQHGIETPLAHVRGLVLSNNITFIQRLTTMLKEFVDAGSKDFGMFDNNAECFRLAYRTLCTRIPELKEESFR
jgi:hypothetical protein